MIKFCGIQKPDFVQVSNLLQESYQEGKLSNGGPLYRKLTEKLKQHFKVSEDRDLVLVSSCHTALMAAYAALEIQSPVMPAYTFRSTWVAAEMQGISSQLVDVDLATGSLRNTAPANDEFTPHDSVVAVCPLSSIPNLDALTEYCKNNGKKLIIDGAATFGTPDIYNYGDAFCISFHATKTLPIGECGAVIASKEVCEKVRQFINFGFNSSRVPVRVGMNAKVSEYTCAIGLNILEESDYLIDKRIVNGSIYKERLGKWSLRSWREDTVYSSYPIYMPSEKMAIKVTEALKGHGIETLQYYKPLAEKSNSKTLFRRNVTLPVHHGVTEDNINRICDIVLTTLNG